MADIADIAQENIDRNLALRIKQTKQANQPTYSTGFCLWCDEKLKPGQRFCDTDCSSDFEKYNNKK